MAGAPGAPRSHGFFNVSRNDIFGGPCRGASIGVSPPRRAHRKKKKEKKREKKKNYYRERNIPYVLANEAWQVLTALQADKALIFSFAEGGIA